MEKNLPITKQLAISWIYNSTSLNHTIHGNVVTTKNTNGIIHQHFTKGYSFEIITNVEVEKDHDKDTLNNRPRKKLEYLLSLGFLALHLTINKITFFIRIQHLILN